MSILQLRRQDLKNPAWWRGARGGNILRGKVSAHYACKVCTFVQECSWGQVGERHRWGYVGKGIDWDTLPCGLPAAKFAYLSVPTVLYGRLDETPQTSAFSWDLLKVVMQTGSN